MSERVNRLYEFGPFRIDVTERLLLRDGQPVSVPPKVFDTLLVLVESGGHLVSKEELLAAVWPDTFVEESNLTVNISALRKLLDKDVNGHNYIDTVPKRGYRFVAKINRRDRPEVEAISKREGSQEQNGDSTPPPLPAYPSNLIAQPTPLIGRAREAADIEKLFRQNHTRLLTLTGPGGIGKTRLALQVAEDLLGDFKDGTYFVPLAAIIEPDLVASQIARALGVSASGTGNPAESLKQFLMRKRLLLILDNFEQVISAAGLVSELLVTTSQLKILITSRTALRLRGEQEFLVPPLGVPDLRKLPPLEMLSQYPAITLFSQRAQAVSPSFALSDNNAKSVVEICASLDGLPLAIELAAARVKMLAPKAMLPRMHNRLELLTTGPRDLPERQRTMRNTIAWSYDLLDESDKILLNRLAVFAGGFTLNAADIICAGAKGFRGDVLDSLSSLLENSLLRQEEQADGDSRFMMLEVIRDFGLEHLIASGEAEALHLAHAEFFLSYVEQAEPELRASNQAAWLKRIEQENSNLRAALHWARETSRGDIGLRMAAALWRFWEIHGHLREGREWLEALLEMTRTTPGLEPVKAKAVYGTAIIVRSMGEYDQAAKLLDEGLALYKALGDKHGVASSLNNLGLMAYEQDDFVKSVTLLNEARALYCELEDEQGVASSLEYLGIVALYHGNYDLAISYQEESLGMKRKLQDKHGIASSLNALAVVALNQGDYGRASKLLADSLSLFQEVNDKLGIASCLNNLGEAAQNRNDFQQAANFYAESLEMFRELGNMQGIATLLNHLGDVARLEFNYERAADLYVESLRLHRELAGKRNIAACFERLGYVAQALGMAQRAATLSGMAEAFRDLHGEAISPTNREYCENYLTALRASLPADLFLAAWSQGRSMELEEAIAYALEGFSNV